MTFSKYKSYPYPISGINMGLWTFLILLLLGLPLLFFPKENMSLWLNSMHSSFLDSFFFYTTYLGDGLVFIPVFLVLLWRNYILSAFFAVFVALEAVIVQLVLKKGVFAHLNRPPAVIENFDQLHQVSGVDLHHLHTFPSGHTQSAFLVAFFLVLLFQNYKFLQLFIPFVALLVGVSRIYLLQHFFVDVWFGALIGFGLPYLTFLLLQKMGKFPFHSGGLMAKFKSESKTE